MEINHFSREKYLSIIIIAFCNVLTWTTIQLMEKTFGKNNEFSLSFSQNVEPLWQTFRINSAVVFKE